MITTAMGKNPKKKKKKDDRMKQQIYKDELWPYYGVTDCDTFGSSSTDTVVDLPEADIRRIHKIVVAFFDVQEELEKMYEKTGKEKG